MKRALLAIAIATGASLASTVPALAAPTSAGARPVANEIERTWIFGHVAQLNVETPSQANPAPDPSLPDANVYLIAPVNPADPFAHGTVIPSPPAPSPIIVAVHDTVQDKPHGPANCYGIDVLDGPKATPQTVLTRPDPNGGAILAYALQFGSFRLYLTNALVINVAAAVGLLKLDHSWPAYGGTCWTGTS